MPRARRLRGDAADSRGGTGGRRRVPIIAMTAHALAGRSRQVPARPEWTTTSASRSKPPISTRSTGTLGRRPLDADDPDICARLNGGWYRRCHPGPMKSHDFDRGILDRVDHRPWPMPAAPWLMRQTWHDLLFAHWPVDKAALAAKLPSSLTLDLYDGEAWLAVVPFHMTNVAPHGVPSLPGMSAFPELNVRTYVRVGDQPGVYFFSLDAANALAVVDARDDVPSAATIRRRFASRRRTAGSATAAGGRASATARGARRRLPAGRAGVSRPRRHARILPDRALLSHTRSARAAMRCGSRSIIRRGRSSRRRGVDSGEHDGRRRWAFVSRRAPRSCIFRGGWTWSPGLWPAWSEPARQAAL